MFLRLDGGIVMKNTHLTLEDRKKIQEGLEKGLSRTEIAKNINKDISTVAKEIILLLVPNLKNVESVMVNALNMKKLNAQEEIEKLAYVIFVQTFLNVD